MCRNYIAEQGYGDYFVHRTGHSIHQSVHGNGANLDNLETKDERRLVPNSCFSIEPGIYKDGIGVRTEIDVLIDGQGNRLRHGPGTGKTDPVGIAQEGTRRVIRPISLGYAVFAPSLGPTLAPFSPSAEWISTVSRGVWLVQIIAYALE